MLLFHHVFLPSSNLSWEKVFYGDNHDRVQIDLHTQVQIYPDQIDLRIQVQIDHHNQVQIDLRNHTHHHNDPRNQIPDQIDLQSHSNLLIHN